MKKQDIVQAVQDLQGFVGPDLEEAVDMLISKLDSQPAAKGKKKYLIEVNKQTLEDNVKYPKQMLEVYNILAETKKPTMTLDEVKEIIGEEAERLNTKQDPYRIYAFYQKRMEDEGWISRSSERVIEA